MTVEELEESKEGSNDALATKADVALLGKELRAEMRELRGELKEDNSQIRKEMSELGSELRGEMAELRTEMLGELGQLGGQLMVLDQRILSQRDEIVGQLSSRMWLGMFGMAGVIFAGQGLAVALMSSI